MSDRHEDWTEIKIATPLPMDVAGTLMQLIGTAYPSAVIVSHKGGWERDYALVMKVDPAQRAKRVTKKQAQGAKPDTYDDGTEAQFLGFDNGWISTSTPEELGLYLGSIAHQMFTGTEGAVNYVEWQVHTGDGDRYVLSVAKSKEQTPHAMRKKAEATIEKVKAALLQGGQTPSIRAKAALRILMDESAA